jgi:hypothetical protein
MEDNEIDKLLDDDTDYTPHDLLAEQVENVGGDITSVKPPPLEIDGLPQLSGSDFPEGFLSVVSRVHGIYKGFPKIDHDKTYSELVSLNVKAKPTPTPQMIDSQLHKVQAVKERLSEIMVRVNYVYSFKKRQVDILKESWICFSQEKSADKRKADATFRLNEFEGDFALIESLWKAGNSILNNLTAVQEILSRRITIMGLEIKMNEMGRHSFPDHDFQGRSLDDIGVQAEKDPDEEGDLEAEECSFTDF